MDSVEKKLNAMEWPYVDSDPAALEELSRRIADAGRKDEPITSNQLLIKVRYAVRM